MEPDFYLIPSIVKKQKGLRPSDWFVYATIYWYEHMAGNKCFASNAAIARASGMGERTVGLALEHLEKCGFIERDFIDRGKTRRSQIHARVFFSQTPSLFEGIKEKKIEGCKYCGDTNAQKFVKDHIVPKSRGGTDLPENIQLICPACNAAKGVMPEEDFARWMKRVRKGGSTGVLPVDTNRRATGGGTGVPQNSNIRKVVTPIAATSAAPVKLFNSEEKKKAWYDGDDEAFQLLAWFFDKKGLWKRFDSEAKVKAAVGRHIRSAHKLVKGDWSQKELNHALTHMLEANPKMREEWTLDTLEKYLTK